MLGVRSSASVMVALLGSALVLNAQAPAAGGGKAPDAKPENANCGLLYGEAHALTFCAPNGWVLDNGIWNDQGIYAVFYPEKSSFDSARDAGTIMYINVVGKAQRSISKVMEDDAAEVKNHSSSAVVKQGDPIKFADGSAPVLYFAPGAYDRYEATAYIDSPKTAIMFIVSSKSSELFNKDYAAFVELVKSYKFLGSDVTVQTK